MQRLFAQPARHQLAGALGLPVPERGGQLQDAVRLHRLHHVGAHQHAKDLESVQVATGEAREHFFDVAGTIEEREELFGELSILQVRR